MCKMKFIRLSAIVMLSLMLFQCGSSKKAQSKRSVTAPKTALQPVQNAPAPPQEIAPSSPVNDVEYKSQPTEIPAPQTQQQLAPMEEGPIEVGSETIKTPTKEQEEAMRNKVQKSTGKTKKGQ